MDFTDILKGLCERAGAQGAAMTDRDGETVASWSASEELDMPLVGAHCEIILDAASEAASIRGRTISSLLISTDRTKLAVMPIKEGYCLVVALDSKAPPEKVLPEALKAIESIESEMG